MSLVQISLTGFVYRMQWISNNNNNDLWDAWQQVFSWCANSVSRVWQWRQNIDPTLTILSFFYAPFILSQTSWLHWHYALFCLFSFIVSFRNTQEWILWSALCGMISVGSSVEYDTIVAWISRCLTESVWAFNLDSFTLTILSNGRIIKSILSIQRWVEK